MDMAHCTHVRGGIEAMPAAMPLSKATLLAALPIALAGLRSPNWAAALFGN